MNDQKREWTGAYQKMINARSAAFPSEYVIRMFKGRYPRLDLRSYGGGYEGKKILDISCGGNGRDLVVLDQLEFSEIAATEISEEIVRGARQYLENAGISADIRVGTNRNLPFQDEEFDYLLAWNVCYYFDEVTDFSLHVEEYARVLKKGGVLVFSIPKADCFIYRDGIDRGNGLTEITNDPYGVRNGILLRQFRGEDEIEDVFGTHFTDFIFGSIEDDCFGLSYKWHIGCCRRK